MTPLRSTLWLLVTVTLVTCGERPGDASDHNLSLAVEDSLLVGEYLFVAKDSATARCGQNLYMFTHRVSPLTRLIAEDQPFDLSNDTLALPLLDSMRYGHDEAARRFYFWIVTKSMDRSDGYFSEGISFWGMTYLDSLPCEFLDHLNAKECYGEKEIKEWSHYLAFEFGLADDHLDEQILLAALDHIDSLSANCPSATKEVAGKLKAELMEYDVSHTTRTR